MNNINFYADIFCDSKNLVSVLPMTSVVLFLIIYSLNYLID